MASSSHLVSENKSCGVFAETSAHSAHAGLVLWVPLRCGRLCLYPSGTSLWAEARDGGQFMPHGDICPVTCPGYQLNTDNSEVIFVREVPAGIPGSPLRVLVSWL